MASIRRPEHKAPPEFFYNEVEARKYTTNTRIIEVQNNLSERAIELLELPDGQTSYLLDIGCGSGLSGECLSDEGHLWVGVDISKSMLDVAREREVEGDLVNLDMGDGLPFRPGSFDGAISISAIQWLCNADKSSHNPAKRLYKFFSTLYACLSRGTRAVMQFYPENEKQQNLITSQALKAGFGGGVVIDNPNSTKTKKLYLVLFTSGAVQSLPMGKNEEEKEETRIKNSNTRERVKQARGKPLKHSREWVLNKKERYRKQGKEVCPDSKYTGRKRPSKF